MTDISQIYIDDQELFTQAIRAIRFSSPCLEARIVELALLHAKRDAAATPEAVERVNTECREIIAKYQEQSDAVH